MSSQFNYDLDERQIRILMQNAELEHDEQIWQKIYSLSVDQTKSGISVSLPKLNVGINRSVIVPIFFILIIGGLSALLFSFVDFKKQEEVIKEMPLNTPVIRKKIIPQTPKVEKPVITHVVKKDSVFTSIPSSTTVTASTQNISTEVVNTNKPIEKVKAQATNTKIMASGSVTPSVVKKKRKSKQITEELPTINASTTNLNEDIKEIELEIK